MTTPIKGPAIGTLCLAAALLPALWSAPAEASRPDPNESTVTDGEAAEIEVQAQGRRKKTEKDGGLLDDIGLGSLDEIPWDAFGLAMVLSALVGAGGGFIYAGIAEPREKAEP